MPSESSVSAAPPPTKANSRGSLRHSLGLASKALADVMNKDDKGTSKKGASPATKDVKDASSRRLIATHSKSSSISPIVGVEGKASFATFKADDMFESKAMSRRRQSLQIHSSQKPTTDEQQPQPSNAPIPRTSSLRPRTSGSSSALPKYRPRSIIVEKGKKPSSPARAGVRRPHSSSDDEGSAIDSKEKDMDAPTIDEKANRPISPLPRKSNKSSISVAMQFTPSKKSKDITSPTPTKKASPARPNKTAKTILASSVNTAIPRPPSSTSSSSSMLANTPKSSLRNGLGSRPATRDKDSPSPSPLRRNAKAGMDLPLASLRRNENPDSPLAARNMSHISEVDSEDSLETDDVANMLAPVAALTAPTPAIPRMQHVGKRQRQRLPPRTPSRSHILPTRDNLSYVSPLPPEKDSSSFLRPIVKGADNKIARGSILTWEELAHDASQTLGEEEIGTLLSDISAPFRSSIAPGSPTPSTMSLQDVPESPCLSAMPSPGGYGSISQVLLPDVTPSPAIHLNMSHRFDFSPADTPPADSAGITLLRLQLASVENTARERLTRLQAMEEEMHDLKTRRKNETEELTKQIAILEEQMLGGLERRERSDEERAAYTRSLEERLRCAQQESEVAIKSALSDAQRSAEESRRLQMEMLLKKCDALHSARAAAVKWESVRDLATCELGSLKGCRDMLSCLLGEVADMHRQLSLSQ